MYYVLACARVCYHSLAIYHSLSYSHSSSYLILFYSTAALIRYCERYCSICNYYTVYVPRAQARTVGRGSGSARGVCRTALHSLRRRLPRYGNPAAAAAARWGCLSRSRATRRATSNRKPLRSKWWGAGDPRERPAVPWLGRTPGRADFSGRCAPVARRTGRRQRKRSRWPYRTGTSYFVYGTIRT